MGRHGERSLRIRLLGPLELTGPDGQVIDLGAAKRCVVLATLALDLNRVVSTERLVDAVWQDRPPPTARAAVQGHVAQLRKVLGDGIELATRAPGYQLLADRSLVDVTRFDDLLAESRNTADTDAVELLRMALRLRRGPALEGLPGEQVQPQMAARLEESGVTAVQQLAERLHRLGRIAEMIELLREAVDHHPLRESLVELLMSGLHHDGQQVEALSLYHRTRALLVDELGVEPGSGLRQAHQMVLSGTVDRPTAAPNSVPAELPRQNRGFVGREAEQAELSATPPDDVAIRLLVGPAGVGKTALALRWSHQIVERFPDGSLFVDLHGFDEQEPVEPATVLTRLLRVLGVPTARIPIDLDERAALYRTVLADHRMLVVLDNAPDADRVRPLLPGTRGCAVLVTSRNRLDDLAATEGAITVSVTALPHNEAVTALGRVAGHRRVESEPEVTAELVELCDRLPLALRIAAGRLHNHPQWTIRAVLDELSDERGRLDALAIPATATSVRGAFARSYHRLPLETARLFRLLGQHMGADIDQYAAAALIDSDPRTARHHLETLTALHLLHEAAPGRYGRSELIRLYARGLGSKDSAEQRATATAQLLDYYVHTAEIAVSVIAERDLPTPLVEYPPVENPDFSTTTAARRWFRAEAANLDNAVELAVAQGHQETARKLESYRQAFVRGTEST